MSADAQAGSFQRLASLAALRSSKSQLVTVGSREVALFLVGDGIVATQGICPHASGPINEGEIEGQTLTCPWHGYCFDLRTGRCEEDPDLLLERFEVRIQGDDVLVRL